MHDSAAWHKADADLQGAYVGVAGLVESIIHNAPKYQGLTTNEMQEVVNMQSAISRYIDRLEELRKRSMRRGLR